MTTYSGHWYIWRCCLVSKSFHSYRLYDFDFSTLTPTENLIWISRWTEDKTYCSTSFSNPESGPRVSFSMVSETPISMTMHGTVLPGQHKPPSGSREKRGKRRTIRLSSSNTVHISISTHCYAVKIPLPSGTRFNDYKSDLGLGVTHRNGRCLEFPWRGRR